MELRRNLEIADRSVKSILSETIVDSETHKVFQICWLMELVSMGSLIRTLDLRCTVKIDKHNSHHPSPRPPLQQEIPLQSKDHDL